MSAILGRLTGRASQNAFRAGIRAASSESKTQVNENVLKKGAKRDPELYILLAIMTGAFGLVGWYFGTKPTASSSEAAVSIASDTMPWQTESKGNGADPYFKYQYHPGGDRNRTPKDAPSALHSTIVPNMTLPKSAHDRFNKYGKDDYF